MAQPTPYDRQANFSNEEALNPTGKTPGASLDAEFNSVKVSLDQTQANLSLIQRDDGALANGSVGQDQLSDSLSIGFTLTGIWGAPVNYLIGDGVTFSNAFYGALSSHLSTSGQTPDIRTDLWQKLVDFNDFAPAVIADGGVTTAKVADSAITSAKIADGTIATGDIADSAITSAKIADGTIATGDIADSAITSAKIADGTIATGDIADSAITNGKLANVATATIKGRTTAGTGSPEDLTATQATALLNAVVGDSGAGGTKGLVPAPAAGDAAAGKYLSAAGTWGLPGAEIFIQTQVASASPTIDFTTGLNDTYDHYIVRLNGVKAVTDDVVLMLRVGTGGGPTYQTAGYTAGLTRLRGGSAVPNSVIFTTSIGLTDSGATAGLGNAAGEKFTGAVEFDNPEAADFCEFMFQGQYGLALGDSGNVVGGGRYNTAGAITALRFMMSSGNIASGRFTLYGVKKSA